jgi:hypothetical protein
MTIQNTSGNIGIGTISPASLFSVGASNQFQVSSSGNIIKVNNIATSFPAAQGAAASYLQNDGSGNLTWVTGGAPNWALGGNAGTNPPTASGPLNNNFIGTTDAKDLSFGNNGSERMRISSGGNVGIGSWLASSPSAFLHVNRPGGTAGNIFELDSAGTARMVATAIGRVGIGTTAPAAWLNVNAPGTVSSGYIMKLDSSGITRMVVKGSGQVGIGTTSPASDAKLAVKDGHFQSQQSATTGVAAGANLGGGAVVLSNATDVAGMVSFTPTGTATSGIMVTVTYAKPYTISSGAPIVILTPANSTAATAFSGNNTNGGKGVYVTSNNGGFSISYNVSPNVAPTVSNVPNQYNYVVIATQ